MRDPDLDAAAKCAGVVLMLQFRNDATGLCNPGFDAIAKAMGRSRRPVIAAVKSLQAAGWIDWVGTKGGSKKNTNSFVFKMKESGTGAVRSTGAVDGNGTSVTDSTGTSAEYGALPVLQTAHELSLNQFKKEAAPQEPSFAGLGSFGAEVRRRIGPDAYGSWFAKASVIAAAPETLTVVLPTKFLADSVRSRFDAVMHDGASAVDPRIVSVNVVAETVDGRP